MNRISWRPVSLLLLAFWTYLSPLSAQKAYTDSLEKVLSATKDPKRQMSLMNELSGSLAKTQPDRSIEYAKKALDIAQKLDNRPAIASGYTNIGNFYFIKGNYPEALKNYLASGKIMEDMGDQKGIAGSYTGIGNVYYAQNDIPHAKEYYLKALKIRESLNDKYGMTGCYNNLGNLCQMEKNYAQALDYHHRSLKLKLELGDRKGLSSSYGNIGLSLYELGQYDSALVYQQKALALRQELNNKAGQAGSYINIGNIYEKQGKEAEAIQYMEKAVELSKALDYKDALKGAYSSLSAAYEKQGNTAKSLEYYKLYTEVKDTMLNAESAKQLLTLQTVYETDKKQKEIVLLTKEREIQDLVLQKQEQELEKQAFENEKKRTQIELLNKQRQIQHLDLQKKESELMTQKLATEAKSKEIRLQQAELETQKLVRNFIIAGLAMTLLLAFFIFRSYQQKKRSNLELADKNEKIQHAYKIIELNRDEIALKNKDIQDSINYAQRIQQAILPPADLIRSVFPESFVLYQPRDVVSGDFYSFIEKNGRTIIAAVDCTGHGVPGAFMSMIGTDQLNQIIVENGITTPSEILSRLNKGIKHALKQTHDDAESKDGMDIAICAFDLVNGTVEYAGAQRPLWCVTNGELKEIKADDVSIGGTTSEDHRFNNHVISYSKGDVFYLFSDGYVDQFGGDNGKKFMSRRFRELVLDIHSKPMSEQHTALMTNFNSWKKDIHQVDDVLVMGVKV
jgi:serine phosphatase RsbU (regulator of sigma subunit)